MDEMLEALAHRGPGVESELTRDVYTHKTVRIGTSGGTLSTTPNRELIAVMDGAIYNFKEIQLKLQKKGRHINMDQPGELLLQAFEVYGENFAEMVDGDFTLCIFDRTQSELYLYRDRVGVKPLYWYSDGRYFLFSSALKSLLATRMVSQKLSYEAAAAYLTLGYIPQDMTPIQNVSKLLPGHFLKYSFNKGVTIHGYWSFGNLFKKESTLSVEEGQEKFRTLILDAANRRTREGPFGNFVSGGIGSACSACALRKLHPKEEIPSFSVNFSGENDSDLQAAIHFAKVLNLDETVDHVTPKNFLDDLPKIVWYLDEPLADPNVTATWRLARLASNEVLVALSGMGSDELLAGHRRYSREESPSNVSYFLKKAQQWLTNRLFIPLMRPLDPTKSFSLLKFSRSNLELIEYLHSGHIFSDTEMKRAAPALADHFSAGYFVHRFHNLQKLSSPAACYQYLDFKTRLPDLYIMQYERLTMAHGVKWRSPFLDKWIIEMLATYPKPESYTDKETAQLLKRALEPMFPKELIQRPKKTREHFLESWVESANLLEVFRPLTSGTLVDSGVIENRWLEEVTASVPAAKNHFRELWALLILETWFRLFIHQPISLEPPKMTIHELLKGKSP